MQLKEIYNYKAADTGLDTRITALENAMGTDGEGTVDARIQAAIDAAKAPLESADTALDGRVTTLEGQVNTLNGDAQTQGSVKQQVATAVAGIVASAPEAYDTLKEIADWISGDVSGAAAMNTRITDNAGAISVLKGDSSTEGSVAKQVADARNALEHTDSALDARLQVLEGDEDTEGSVAEAKAVADQALEEARACVAIDQGTPNAGHMLWVSGSGEVTSEVPTQIMLMDSARTKTFVLTIGTEGALTVSEVVA